MNTALLVKSKRLPRWGLQTLLSESFSSIIGYKGNGALLSTTRKAEGSKVTNDSSILVDSGGPVS